MKKTVMTVVMTSMILFMILFASNCTKNFYDEELRDEVVQNRIELIDESLVLTKDDNDKWKFSRNYLAGLYRLALLGKGINTEDEIVNMIDDYKVLIDEIRKKHSKTNPQTKDK